VVCTTYEYAIGNTGLNCSVSPISEKVYYLRNSIWIGPIVMVVAAIIAVRILHWTGEAIGWEANLNPETARVVLGSLAGAMFTFIVFVCSALLLVVQLASAQLTPRVIGTMFRDRVIKLTLVVFVFFFTFAVSAMVRIGSSVPPLVTQFAAYGCVASIGVFLYLIDHVGKKLRPSGVFASVAAEAHRVIESVYPRRLSDDQEAVQKDPGGVGRQPARVVPSTEGGVVLAFDVPGLVELGSRHDCVIELAPQVGNFVAPGDPLFHVRGGPGLSAESLHGSVALGAERTMEQDPAFGFRLIVDIACKGLSPAINDPTTAVLAIDRIHHLLRHVGKRRLDNERVTDVTGRVRLTYRTPDWEDFVVLAVTEIRQFGGASIQIARRLRAMLENLIATLPTVRAEPLRRQLQLLANSTQRFFHDPEDRALADESDSQGMGGANEPDTRRSQGQR
jgi:uncharacterized membrane protein